jgi:hypothetical protein
VGHLRGNIVVIDEKLTLSMKEISYDRRLGYHGDYIVCFHRNSYLNWEYRVYKVDNNPLLTNSMAMEVLVLVSTTSYPYCLAAKAAAETDVALLEYQDH